MVARVRGRPHRIFGLVVPGGWVVAVVAALQGSSSAFVRRILMRRRSAGARTAVASVLAVGFGVLLAAGLGIATMTPVAAQSFNPPHTRAKPPPPPAASMGQMLVQAVEVDYDYNNSRV